MNAMLGMNKKAATVIYLLFALQVWKKSILVELNQFCLQSCSASENHLCSNNVVWVETTKKKETSVVNGDCSL